MMIPYRFLLAAFVVLSFTSNSFATKLEVDKNNVLYTPLYKCFTRLCFGIEGSSAINDREFQAQKQIVRTLVSTYSKTFIKSKLELAAVQYGISNDRISRLTKDIPSFLKSVENASSKQSTSTALGSPIVYCNSVLAGGSNRYDDSAIILLGRGANTIGGDPGLRADIFRQTKKKGKIIAVQVGWANEQTLDKVVDGDNNKIIRYNGDVNETVKKVLVELCDARSNAQ